MTHTPSPQQSEQLFDALARQGLQLPAEHRRTITDRLERIRGYEPLVGVFGKTGAGKSSLCNAVFGRDICPISDVGACTRTVQEVALNVGQKGMKLLDVPGVGESDRRDAEYDALYRDWLPRLDLVLWVIKADDRALASDEDFYKRLVKPYLEAGKPFFIVLNQVDKVEPFREWDEQARQPGPRQAANIEDKRRSVAGFFGLPLNQVLAVSANERYGLVELVDRVIHELPAEKRVSVLREVQEEYRSQAAREQARSGVAETLGTVIDALPLPAPVKFVAKAIVRVFDWIGSWF
ncbi:GTPase family protein [Pseudomonas sp. AN-1]|uniref:GTPase family protein n=1 Tax=Pseudomonas sp. AN-1 TaxID=3096605 RepID=UPI002A6A6307|nr:GTPase [Pseudomonas sp. AN-1]WPP46945.1 GTPase [Pseudomonas sp. AN-1]